MIHTKLKVLCIEDDIAVSDFISSLLDKDKYQVEKINDGKEAFDFLLSTVEPPDIILLDYRLPSMDGIQILENLKAHKKNYAIVFLTADETMETAVLAMKAGALDYMTKKSYLKAELNIKIEKAYQISQDRLKKDFYEAQLSILKMAIEQSPISIVITNKDGDIEYVNKKYTESSGYSFREVLGRNQRFLKTNSYEPGFFENVWTTITSGQTWKGEFTNQKKNGEIYYEEAIVKPVYSKSGEITSFLGIKQDVTEFKKIGDELSKKNEEMNRFFMVALDLLCLIENKSKKFIRLNNAWENSLGYTLDELMNKSYTDLVHPDDLEATIQASIKLENTGHVKNFVNRCRCKNGKYKFIEWSFINNNDGTSSSSARDISERKLNELALKESEARFRSIFEMSNAGIFFSDKNGQIVLGNQAFVNTVEFTIQELYLMDFSQFTHLDDLNAENKVLKQLINGEIERYRIEKRYVSKTGKIIWVDLALSVIRDDAGAPLNYVGVVNDISGRKLYENKLESINNTKNKFFSIISHDLRNQFSGIQGLTEILMLKGSQLDEHKQKQIYTLLNNGGKSALSLLENLLEWSRSQLDRVEINQKSLNLYTIVDEVFQVLENQSILKQIIILNKITLSHHIWADENMIKTVIRNILNNAIKFTPAEGQIVLTSRIFSNMDIIDIHDTGIGMSQERIANLFKIETAQSTSGTNNESGTGLGLILSNEFIIKHGGKITVESKLGEGSKFSISLPVITSK